MSVQPCYGSQNIRFNDECKRRWQKNRTDSFSHGNSQCVRVKKKIPLKKSPVSLWLFPYDKCLLPRALTFFQLSFFFYVSVHLISVPSFICWHAYRAHRINDKAKVKRKWREKSERWNLKCIRNGFCNVESDEMTWKPQNGWMNCTKNVVTEAYHNEKHIYIRQKRLAMIPYHLTCCKWVWDTLGIKLKSIMMILSMKTMKMFLVKLRRLVCMCVLARGEYHVIAVNRTRKRHLQSSLRLSFVFSSVCQLSRWSNVVEMFYHGLIIFCHFLGGERARWRDVSHHFVDATVPCSSPHARMLMRFLRCTP